MLALSSLNTDQTGSPDCPIAFLANDISVTFKRVHGNYSDEGKMRESPCDTKQKVDELWPVRGKRIHREW
jgi:hypothetical protein